MKILRIILLIITILGFLMLYPNTSVRYIGMTLFLCGFLSSFLLSIVGLFSKKADIFQSLRNLSFLVFLGGILFKIMHWPFAGPIMISGCVFLLAVNIIYFIKNRKTNINKSILNMMGSFLCVGFLFGFLHWPYSTEIIFSTFSAFFVYSIFYLATFKSKNNQLKP